jgi:hypothetical protein
MVSLERSYNSFFSLLVSCLIGLPFDLEDEGNKILQNISDHLETTRRHILKVSLKSASYLALFISGAVVHIT